MRLNKLNAATIVAMVLAAVGALNWGLTALFRFNLVHRLFGRWRDAERGVYGVVGLAGVWLLLQLLVPYLAVAFGARRRRAAAGRPCSIVGQQLPTLEGDTLAGRHVRLPDDTAGNVAFLVTGYSYDSRYDVEDWVEAFRERYQEHGDVTFYEIPMIGGLARFGAPMIDAGMRQGTPTDLHDRVLTVYASSVKPIREALCAGPEYDTWVYLVDRDGTVLFQSGGPFDEAKFGNLARIADAAVVGTPAP